MTEQLLVEATERKICEAPAVTRPRKPKLKLHWYGAYWCLNIRRNVLVLAKDADSDCLEFEEDIA